MAVEGTVVNGTVILDEGGRLPEGARVRVELTEDEDDIAPPPEQYDRAEVIAILRESLEDAEAGRVIPAREVLKQIAARHGLPLEPGE